MQWINMRLRRVSLCCLLLGSSYRKLNWPLATVTAARWPAVRAELQHQRTASGAGITSHMMKEEHVEQRLCSRERYFTPSAHFNHKQENWSARLYHKTPVWMYGWKAVRQLAIVVWLTVMTPSQCLLLSTGFPALSSCVEFQVPSLFICFKEWDEMFFSEMLP